MNLETLTKEMGLLFRSNLEEFFEKEDTSSLNSLTPTSAQKMIKHTKALIRKIGVLTLEQFFTSYDVEGQTIEIDGALHRFKYESSRDFLTSLGKIRLNRRVYQKDSGGKAVVPLDRMWNMEHQYLSAELKEGVLYSSAHNTPEETSRILDKFGMTRVHASTIKQVIDQVGQNIEAKKKQITQGIYEHESLPQKSDVMVCSLDGVNVLLNQKGKRKGRPKERPHPLGSDSSASNYKNAMCGSVSLYNVEYQEDKGRLQPIRLQSKYVARMPEPRFEIFKKQFEEEVVHGMNSNPKAKILVVDAHLSIQGYIKDNPLLKDFHCLIDFYHACEHLSKLSEWIFGKSKDAAQKWYNQKREILRSSPGGVDKLIQSANYYIRSTLTKKSKIKGAIKELKYFSNHRQMMRYHFFVDKGWPIGSGVVEAACKSIVKQRMCRSGQRWTVMGGQHILSLRSYVKSNRWDYFYKTFQDINHKMCA